MTKSKSNCQDCTSVNMGLIVAIVILGVITLIVGCTCEGFSNIFTKPNYKIPKLGEQVPDLQGLTTPIFPPYSHDVIDQPTVIDDYSVPVTQEDQIDILEHESVEKIKEAEKIILEETVNIEKLRNIRAPRPKRLTRVTPGRNVVAQRPRSSSRR